MLLYSNLPLINSFGPLKGGLWATKLTEMQTLETLGRQSFQALIVMLLAFLSQVLGLLQASMGPCDGDDCSMQAWELGQAGRGT